MKQRIRFRLPWKSQAAIDSDLAAELEFHLETRTDALIAEGLSRAEARRIAEKEFGDLEGTRAYCRAQDAGLSRGDRRRDWFDVLRGNVRYAFRSLRRSPGFTAITLTTLALALGANTAIFSVANAILIAPLPYGEPDRVVALFEARGGSVRADMSAADLVDYRASQTTLTGIGLLARGGVVFRTGPDDPVAMQQVRVSADMFDVLRARAERGRTFVAGEDGSPPAPVAVLTHDAWMRVFGGDTTVIGRTVYVSDQPVKLIGVMPRGFGLGYAEDLYSPLDMAPLLNDPNRSRKMHWLFGVGRLRPGVTVDAARADLNRIARSLEQEHKDANTGHLASVIPMQAALAGSAERTTYLLLGAAGLVLLVACANLINMTLARAASRSQELTIRAAIGAGRKHLVSHLVAESAVLAVVGGAIGVAIAVALTKLIVNVSPTALPPLAVPALDWRVVTFSLAVSLGVGLVVGIVPALRMSRVDISEALRRGGRGGERHGNALRGAFVVSQTAMAVVLLVVAGLLVRSLASLRQVDLGFDPSNTVAGAPVVRGPRYQTLEAFNTFYEGVFEHLRRTPGVVAVGASAGVPLLGSSGCGLTIEGREPAVGQQPMVRCSAARGDYYRAMGIPIVRGRDFDRARDLPNGPDVVLINEAMTREFFPNEDPVGKRIKLGPDPAIPWATIIGVTGDVRQNNLESAPTPSVMEFDAQQGWGSLVIVVRMEDGDPMRVAPAFREAIRAADPSLALRQLRSMNDVIGLQLSQRRLTMTLIAGFAVLALALSAVGIYGVLAFGVTARTRELGIRRALGATTRAVRLSILRRGMTWSIAGLAIGGVAAAFIARWMRSSLYGVAPYDAPTYIAVGAVLLVVAVIACVVPARRAVRVDPLIAMRAE